MQGVNLSYFPAAYATMKTYGMKFSSIQLRHILRKSIINVIFSNGMISCFFMS